jgi:MFS family permease
MSANPSVNAPPEIRRSRVPFYYGWVIVGVAARAMTATLPGRSHGLGLITEPLIADLHVERTMFARINLVSSLLGAAFCLPIGYLLDRFGVRLNLTAVTAGLGLSVLGMSRISGLVGLFFAFLCVRSLGQSALSVVSMTAVGKWFRYGMGIAMGVYSVLLTIGFIGSILWIGDAVKQHSWREAWAVLGWILLVIVAPLSWLLQRDTPEECGQTLDPPATESANTAAEAAYTMKQALRTPAFWVFALGTATFNLAWSGITLFNESALRERGFNADVAVQVIGVLTAAGLISNLIAGAIAKRERLGVLLGLGMAVLTAALAMVPTISGSMQLSTYAAAMGLTGGLVMLVFFAAWSQVFGRIHLGQIQGVAQLISVLAFACGPVLLAECQQRIGVYGPIFYALACVTGGLSLAAFWVKIPAIQAQAFPETFPAPFMPAAVEN